MSIKRNRQTSGFPERISHRYTLKDDKPIPTTSSNIQIRTNYGVLFKKSEKLIQSLKQKRQIAPDKLKRMRHVFTTISNSQSSNIKIFLSLKKNLFSSACRTFN